MSALVKTNAQQVHNHWGDNPPDWILALAHACDSTSQAKASIVVGYSAAAINQVLKHKYPGSLSAVENAVRGAFMNLNVGCPVLGEIPANTCQVHQRQPYANTNPMRIRLYRACRSGCPYAKESAA